MMSDNEALINFMGDVLSIDFENTALAWNTAITVCEDMEVLLAAFGAEDEELKKADAYKYSLCKHSCIERDTAKNILDKLMEVTDSFPTLNKLDISFNKGDHYQALNGVLVEMCRGNDCYEYKKDELTQIKDISVPLKNFIYDFFESAKQNIENSLRESGVPFEKEKLDDYIQEIQDDTFDTCREMSKCVTLSDLLTCAEEARKITFNFTVYEEATEKEIADFDMKFDSCEDAEVFAKETYNTDCHCTVDIVKEPMIGKLIEAYNGNITEELKEFLAEAKVCKREDKKKLWEEEKNV